MHLALAGGTSARSSSSNRGSRTLSSGKRSNQRRGTYQGRCGLERPIAMKKGLSILTRATGCSTGVSSLLPIENSPAGTLTRVIVTSSPRRRKSAAESRSGNVAGLIVVKNGTVVYERYELGNTAESRWLSYSVAKSVTFGFDARGPSLMFWAS